jgi:two-component system nitrogen regulation response regulator GlnG
VRIISATNRDLAEVAKRGQFRQDLYYRLAVFPIQLPPLRERREDILPLAHFFHAKFAAEEGQSAAGIAPEAEQALYAYDWPGNVRELENTCARLALMAPGREILPADVRAPASSAAPAGSWADALRHWARAALAAGHDQVYATAKRELDRTLLDAALEQTQGHRQNAALRLGLGRNTITRKLGARRRRKSGEKFR